MHASPRRHPATRSLRGVAAVALVATGAVATLASSASAAIPRGSDRAIGIAHASAAGTLPVPAGFPSATTTGVPSGVQLTPYTGSMTIKKAGTVISGALITGCLVVDADNVTIRDSKITCGQNRAVLSLQGSAVGTLVSDVELDGTGSAIVGLEAKNCVAARLNIHGTGDGVHLGRDVTLEDSYIHDLARQPDLHHDDLQTLSGSTASNITVLHNTLQDHSASSNGNSVYHLGAGAISGVLVSGNYMDGGQYTIQVDNGPAQKSIVFSANQFGPNARYGLINAGNSGTAITFTGNVWQTTGAAALSTANVRHAAS